MMRQRLKRERKSGIFLHRVAEHSQVVVMVHDNPDPDAIASGWALTHLIRARLGRRVPFLAGGDIVRAENRAMMEILKPPLELRHEAQITPRALVVLSDCMPESTNHPPFRPSQPLLVVDHHLGKKSERSQIVFQDLRPKVIATASIAASYLREQRVMPSPGLATALLYAIRTESKGGETQFSALDHEMLTWLTRRANPSQLAQIEDAPLAPDYFSDLALALQSASRYGDCAFCLLPQNHGPEIVGEVADLLIRCEGLDAVLCGAVHHGSLVLSIRSDRLSSKDAVELTRRVVSGLGHGGGHLHRAGGLIPNVGPAAIKVREMVLRRWLEACGAADQRPARLVPRRSILQNL